MRQPDVVFNDILLESIDATISSLLSPDVVDALYAHLRTFHSISRNDLPYRLDILVATLEKIFGVRGAQTISNAIARRLYLKLDLNTANSDRTFLEYVDEARLKLQTSQSR